MITVSINKEYNGLQFTNKTRIFTMNHRGTIEYEIWFILAATDVETLCVCACDLFALAACIIKLRTTDMTC